MCIPQCAVAGSVVCDFGVSRSYSVCVWGGGEVEGCLLVVVVVVVFPGQKSIFFDRSNSDDKIDNANFVV